MPASLTSYKLRYSVFNLPFHHSTAISESTVGPLSCATCLHVLKCLCGLLAVTTSQFSVLTGRKCNWLAERMLITCVMRHATSNEWPNCSFLYCSFSLSVYCYVIFVLCTPQYINCSLELTTVLDVKFKLAVTYLSYLIALTASNQRNWSLTLLLISYY